MRIVKGFAFVMMISGLMCVSCSTDQPSADEIISKAIERHGGDKYSNMAVDFDFRNQHFEAIISDNDFEFKKSYVQRNDSVLEVYAKKAFARYINNSPIDLSKEREDTFYGSSNSVLYFALLPYRLDDPAVNTQLMCTSKVKGEPYYKVEITFDGNGGGENFEDVFVYWIHKEKFTVDYLAYSFHINGGGVRFREAYNQREVNGIRFQDYVNYTIDKDFPAHELDFAFESGQLREISRINLENIQVAVK